MNTNLKDDFDQIKWFLTAVMTSWSLPAEIITRRRFGQDYLNPWKAFLATLMLLFFTTIGEAASLGLEMRFVRGYFWVFFFLLLWRLAEPRWLFWRHALMWHSRSDGVPYRFVSAIPLVRTHHQIYRAVIEPGMWILMGIILVKLVGWEMFGLIITTQGFAFGMKELVSYSQSLTTWRAHVNSSIEAQYASAITAGIPPDDTQGAYNPHSSLINSATALRDRIDQLDANARQVLLDALTALEDKPQKSEEFK